MNDKCGVLLNLKHGVLVKLNCGVILPGVKKISSMKWVTNIFVWSSYEL